MATQHVRWFVSPRGPDANASIANAIANPDIVIKQCVLEDGRREDVHVYEITQRERDDFLQGDSRSPRDFFRQQPGSIPRYWHPRQKERRAVASAIVRVKRRRNHRLLHVGLGVH